MAEYRDLCDTMYEKFLGISTDLEQTDYDGGDYYAFQSTGYSSLEKIFNSLNIGRYDTLVDFGCGLGRVLFFVSHRYMCNIKGIEYDKELFSLLEDNAEYYHVRFRQQREKFQLLNMKAEDYEIAPADNYFYFFNPFSTDILKEIIEKILESTNQNPRKIYIIFYYCTEEYIRAMRAYPLRLKEAIKMNAYFIDPEEKAYIYTNDL